MSPEQAIAALDRQIAEHGQDVTLRRAVQNEDAIERDARAFVRGYRPDELVGGIQQGDTQVTISPTSLPQEFADTDADRLRRNDRIVIDGRRRNIEFANPVRMNGVLVRINCLVRG